MSVVPSRHFPPAASFIDSFHTSLSKFHFHGVSLPLSRYSFPFIPFGHRNSNYCSLTHNSLCSNLTNWQNPNSGIPQNSLDGGSSSGWLAKWKEPHHRKFPKQPKPLLNYRASRNDSVLSSSSWGSNDSSVVAPAGFGSGSTMDRIVEKLKKFGYMDDANDNSDEPERVIEKGSVEDIFYVEEGMLPDKRGGFSSVSLLGMERELNSNGEVRFPWEEPSVKAELAENSVKRRSRTFMAELTLPESELRRLTNLTFKTKQKVKIGGGGVTQAVVDAIHEKWKSAEIVRIKVEGAPALNMKRMHEILERKTGGLVIWRSGTSVSLYRGVSYEVPQVEIKKWTSKKKRAQISVPSLPYRSQRNSSQDNTYESKHFVNDNFQKTSVEKNDSELVEIKYEDEIDKLLSDLGPRYTDWPGGDPLPIDADLLPNVVPGYQPPFRMLPYGVRPALSRNEATALRRIARTLPPHFALGRSRHLEGLAEAIVKLWERSSIVKVALKRGVQLTTSERMAEEIKRLTGGILLSRSKDFLVYYRGKNFLSSDVTKALLERERLAKALQDQEEQARMRASTSAIPNAETEHHHRAAGTLFETLDANAKWGKRIDDEEKEKLLREAEFLRHANLVRKLENKLAFAERKLLKAEQTLSKVEEFLKPSDRQQDPDSISDEERFMFRKLGLRMKAFLLLGRRGVFDGTIENMHLHWKYRELVKIIVKARSLEDAKTIALSLEAESGGVLVSLDKVSKGYAIIVYRGKDYQRPVSLRPQNLLTKRKALARSIELQRREALLKHIAQLQKNAEKLRSEIDQMNTMKDQNDAEFYDSLDAAYPTEDEDSEEEGDEVYLETYNNENDEDESNIHIHSSHPETKNAYNFQDRKIEAGSAAIKEGEDEANDCIYACNNDDENEHFG